MYTVGLYLFKTFQYITWPRKDGRALERGGLGLFALEGKLRPVISNYYKQGCRLPRPLKSARAEAT